MATASFHRHVRRCVDAATSRVFAKIDHRPHLRDAFARLRVVAHERSDLMRTRPSAGGTVEQVDVILGLAQLERAWVNEPEDWPGGYGHPLFSVHSLASHLCGVYPTPRFLASAWFGEPTPAALQRRRWFVAHARGQRIRELSVPIAMTRKMEHVFLRSADHLGIDHALRRAEVIGLGGTPELADAVVATRLGRSFDDPIHARQAIEFFVRVQDDLDLAQVGPIVDYLHAMRGRELPRGRTLASMQRQVRGWHDRLARRADPTRLAWPRSRWNELRVPIERAGDDDVPTEWRVIELLDAGQLVAEGRAMHHCVATYAQRCHRGATSIWSLRTCDGEGTSRRSHLTIEIELRSGTIVQVKGPSNSRPTGRPVEVLRQWVARERLAFSSWVLRELSHP